MELALTAEQDLLRSSTADYITRRCPLSLIRTLLDSPTGLPDGYLEEIADLGAFNLLVPDSETGMTGLAGEGIRDLVLLAEERGRVLQPGPFVPMNVVIQALASLGPQPLRDTLLPELVAGRSTATWVPGGIGVSWQSAGPIYVERDESGDLHLTGQGGVVLEASGADWLLVTAGRTEGCQVLIPADRDGVTIKPVASLDITHRYADVSFDGVRVSAEETVGTGESARLDADYQLQLASVLNVAETVGAMDVLFQLTCEYAKDRIAFGRPIGSFQAVKHQLADLSLNLETSKAISAAAAHNLQRCTAGASSIASIAAAWVGERGIELAQGCFQVFGGIGYTWDHDLHLYLRRITMNAYRFGSPTWHRERLCLLKGI